MDETRPPMPSPSISINSPQPAGGDSSPSSDLLSRTQYHSPIRHHRRTSSRNTGCPVKETLNAQSHYGGSEDDGTSIVRVNQYILREEIGRGSFGAVHLAVDQYGAEFAVKEFSKSRLRKRAQSNLLRKPNQKRASGYLAADPGFYPSHHRQSSSGSAHAASNNSLDLIKEEIAIMKKLDHHNLVSLIEVLDDPEEDSLYMVLEMCKKGVVMKVGLDDVADPYDNETCRCWFRDMILGIEYLHAQGIIHRDIKPDNCLVDDGDVLKIVDFGVSEMFEKDSNMSTSKHAGSPAFMPPELCVAKHGTVSGRAADIWSMGVTLFCLRYGKIPFQKDSLPELYDSIRDDPLILDGEDDDKFCDLMRKMLEKAPEKRITMRDIRVHPWVTKQGQDHLLSEEENCADIVSPPTEAEKNHAITDNMGHLMAVVSAVKRFKGLLARKKPRRFEEAIVWGRARLSTSPHTLRPGKLGGPNAPDERNRERTHHSLKNAIHKAGAALHRTGRSPALDERQDDQSPLPSSLTTRAQTVRQAGPESGQSSPDHMGHNQAHDPLTDTLYLAVGPGHGPACAHEYATASHDPHAHPPAEPVVSESPGAVDGCIFEEAYKQEIERIKNEKGTETTTYANRWVEAGDAAAETIKGVVGKLKGKAAK